MQPTSRHTESTTVTAAAAAAAAASAGPAVSVVWAPPPPPRLRRRFRPLRRSLAHSAGENTHTHTRARVRGHGLHRSELVGSSCLEWFVSDLVILDAYRVGFLHGSTGSFSSTLRSRKAHTYHVACKCNPPFLEESTVNFAMNSKVKNRRNISVFCSKLFSIKWAVKHKFSVNFVCFHICGLF